MNKMVMQYTIGMHSQPKYVEVNKNLSIKKNILIQKIIHLKLHTFLTSEIYWAATILFDDLIH